MACYIACYELDSAIHILKPIVRHDQNLNDLLNNLYTCTDKENIASSRLNEYGYNNNNQILYIAYTWDPATNSWLESVKDVTTYDPNSNIVLNLGKIRKYTSKSTRVSKAIIRL